MKSVFSRFATALVAGLICAGGVSAQQATVIRLSHGMPEALDSGQHAWALVFKEAVESGSGGRLEVRILGNNAAGNERQQLERVQNGINQMLLVSEITQPFFFKPALVLGMPFLFSSSQVAWEVLDGPFGQRYDAEFQKATGVRILGHIESGFRSIFNSKVQVKTPDDLKGMKVRTGENAVHMAMVRGLGASPVPVSWTEVYTALQQKLVDGMENPPGLFFSMKFYEQQKHLTLNKHLYSVHTAMVNEKFFQGLTAEQRQVVMSSAHLATTIGRSQAFLLERAAIENLKKQGIQVYTPTAAEFDQFRKQGRPPAEALVRKEIGNDWVDAAIQAVGSAEQKLTRY
jgi:tripartite ATP-independent transporter DctP family solute receptor